MTIFDTLESNVQSYAHSFPVVFDKARGSRLYDESGEAYLDFQAGCGSLNYGHNNTVLKRAHIEYLDRDNQRKMQEAARAAAAGRTAAPCRRACRCP